MSNNLPKSDLDQAEMLKNMVTSCASGGSRDSSDYAAIRFHFMRIPEISEKLPRFIKTCRNLQEFWDFIKPKYDHYHERRHYVTAEFEPLLAALEAGANSPADQSVTDQIQKVDSAHVQQA